MGWWQRLFGSGKPTDGDEDRLAVVQRLLAAAQAATNAEATTTTADVLDNILAEIRAAFATQQACIHFVREGAVHPDNIFHGVQTCPVLLSATEDTLAHFAALEKAAMQRARELGGPVQVSAVRDELLTDLATAADFVDGLIVPIAYQGDAFAWINVYLRWPRRFDAIDRSLLRAVGGVLYGAIKKEAFISALQRIRATLETHFSPRVVDKLVSDPESFAEQRSERLDVSVLFSDIRGFTALSERLEADEVAAMMSAHLNAMAEVVFKYDGIVDKYIGDAVMAVFGSPFPQGDHPQRAVAAALEMLAVQRKLGGAVGRAGGQPAGDRRRREYRRGGSREYRRRAARVHAPGRYGQSGEPAQGRGQALAGAHRRDHVRARQGGDRCRGRGAIHGQRQASADQSLRGHPLYRRSRRSHRQGCPGGRRRAGSSGRG